MMQRDFWTTFELAELIDIGPTTLQRRVYTLRSDKPIRIGGTYIIRKYQFFKWYREGGRDILDAAFPKKKIAHNNIEREMNAYYARFINEGRNCG
jgi:hypothetical protein